MKMKDCPGFLESLGARLEIQLLPSLSHMALPNIQIAPHPQSVSWKQGPYRDPQRAEQRAIYLMQSELKSKFWDWIPSCVHQCLRPPKQVCHFTHMLWSGSQRNTGKGTGWHLYSKYQDPGGHFTRLVDSWVHSWVSQFGAELGAEQHSYRATVPV